MSEFTQTPPDPRDGEIEHLRHTLALQQAIYERLRQIDQAEIERLMAELEKMKGAQ